jgi:predicted CXXCH cytochrome family protein
MHAIFRYLGLILLSIGFFVVVGTYSSAQDGEPTPEYVGARECNSCHRDVRGDMAGYCEDAKVCHARALQAVSGSTNPVLADFSVGDDLRVVQFPGESESRPFTADDIAFVMGAGRYVQRFVYKSSDDRYLVLPAEWNTVNQQWDPLILGETWPDDNAYDWGQNCARCHTSGLTSTTPLQWLDDGVVCEACHGPGSAHVTLADEAGTRPSKEEMSAIRGAIAFSPDPQICGQCHSQGHEPDTNHPFPLNYRPGDNLLDPAIFELVATDSADHWWLTGQARRSNMQYNEWLNSGHATALDTLKSDPAADDSCLACHSGDYRWNQQVIARFDEGFYEGDPPAPLTVAIARFGVVCITCHNVHATSAENDFFLVAEPYALCTECHSDTDASDGLHHPVQQMFEGSLEELGNAIPSAHFSAENGPECVTCHLARVPVGNFTLASHSLQIVAPGPGSDQMIQDSCTVCHQQHASAAAMQALIDDTQTSVQARLQAARTALQGDEPPWVMRALDFVEGDGSLGIHNYAYTDFLLDAIEAELDQATSTPEESAE